MRPWGKKKLHLVSFFRALRLSPSSLKYRNFSERRWCHHCLLAFFSRRPISHLMRRAGCPCQQEMGNYATLYCHKRTVRLVSCSNLRAAFVSLPHKVLLPSPSLPVLYQRYKNTIWTRTQTVIDHLVVMVLTHYKSSPLEIIMLIVMTFLTTSL